MSPVVILIYEILYAIIFFGLLFSKSTFLSFFPTPSNFVRIIFVTILFIGFYIPFFLKLLQIRLRTIHYIFVLLFFTLIYIVASFKYYAKETSDVRFGPYHPFLQIKPRAQKAEVPKPKGVFRIICLGGSTTEENTNVKDSYPDFLYELLRKKYPNRKIEVINAGRFFYSTQHSIIQYLFGLKELDPDVIILFHAANDLIMSFTMPPLSSGPFRKDYGHFFGYLGTFRYPRSFEKFLASFFYADLRTLQIKPSAFSDFKSLYSFQRNLATMVEITRAKGITLILSNQAHCFSNNNDSGQHIVNYIKAFLIDKDHYADERSWYEGMEAFNNATRDIAEKYLIPFVDHASFFKNKQEFFTDPWHMTTEGRKLKARLFFEKIVQLKLLEDTGD
jgi:lysophospholipase L1-like esterase